MKNPLALAGWFASRGRIFHREAESLEKATETAVKDVTRAGYAVARVEG